MATPKKRKRLGIRTPKISGGLVDTSLPPEVSKALAKAKFTGSLAAIGSALGFYRTVTAVDPKRADDLRDTREALRCVQELRERVARLPDVVDAYVRFVRPAFDPASLVLLQERLERAERDLSSARATGGAPKLSARDDLLKTLVPILRAGLPPRSPANELAREIVQSVVGKKLPDNLSRIKNPRPR